MQSEDGAREELRRLVELLELSGLAERRGDVRELLELSRGMLQAPRHPAAPSAPFVRPPPSARKIAGKLGVLAGLGLDGLVAGTFFWGLGQVLTGAVPAAWRPDLLALLAGPAWLLFRVPAVPGWLYEGGFYLLYHWAWGWDWLAEGFSRSAMERFTARCAAREVMWAWRRHRLSLLHHPGLSDVESFLEQGYGKLARKAFRERAEAMGRGGASLRGGGADGRAAVRLARLRWSALIRLFEAIAASRALWPPPEPESPPIVQADEPGAEPPPEPPERAQRRSDLREVIRRKRQDISTAHGWKLKTPGEVAQRDAYLRQTREEIAALERELAALG
ncbi:hypothetical protein [Roseococcus sp. YIM B11640]|uniref:hypothetical protein n=1 Tax=Roseococcus sp. YIM B11640 TaxID=3133973 RepID=UPI003C7A2707